MTTMHRPEVQRLADAWAHMPEGAAGTPLLSVSMTPRALLLIMDRFRMTSVEAMLVPGFPPLRAEDVGDTAPDTTDDAISRLRAAGAV